MWERACLHPSHTPPPCQGANKENSISSSAVTHTPANSYFTHTLPLKHTHLQLVKNPWNPSLSAPIIFASSHGVCLGKEGVAFCSDELLHLLSPFPHARTQLVTPFTRAHTVSDPLPSCEHTVSDMHLITHLARKTLFN